MTRAFILKDLNFGDSQPALSVILDTPYTREVRILFREGQVMKEHKAAYPIVVAVVKGEIGFSAGTEKIRMTAGDMVALDARVLHELTAIEESVVRLSIYKGAQG